MIRRLARDYPVTVFVLVTFVWTWTIDLTLRATLGARPSDANHDRWLSVHVVAGYGPTVGALVTSGLRGGWRAMGQLARRLLPWRVSVWWCLLAFGLPSVFYAVAIALYAWRGGAIGPFVAPNALATLTYVGIKLTRGPLAEELGWRGFALQVFQTRYSALTSSVFIGVIWFLWHLPMVWMYGTFISTPSVTVGQLAWFAIALVSLAVLETWVVNRTGGSVVPAVLMHGGGNVVLPLLFLPELSGDAYRSIAYLSLIPSLVCSLAVTIISTGGDHRRWWRRSGDIRRADPRATAPQIVQPQIVQPHIVQPHIVVASSC